MRLQRDQLSISLGKGRQALAARKKAFAETPSAMTLQLYFSLLDNLDRYEDILSIQETESQVREILFPPSPKNLSIWRLIVHAAAETGDTGLIERSLPSILEACGGEDEYEFLSCLLDIYRDDEQAAIKRRMLTLLPGLSLNKYFEEKARQRIEQA